MAITQAQYGKFAHSFSLRFTGRNSNDSEKMVAYIAQKMSDSLQNRFSLHSRKIDKSGSDGKWYLWEYVLQSKYDDEEPFVGILSIKQPWGGDQIWFWVKIAPFPQFQNMDVLTNDRAILAYLSRNP